MLFACFTIAALVTVHSMCAASSSYINIYEDPFSAASSWKPVSCDGHNIANIKKGTFFAVSANLGQHDLQIAGGTPTIINVQLNQDAFLRVDQHVTIGEPTVLLLTLMKPELARKEIRFLAYIPGGESALIQRERQRSPKR